jgi:cytochrome P450
MSIDYDPLSEEAMLDARPLYAELRAHDPVHYMERYDAWALASFDAVWQACSDTASLSVRRGQTPNQILLGEPATNLTFPELDPPEHRLRRRVLAPFFTRDAAQDADGEIRAIAREVLEPLLARGHFDAFDEYASRVTSRVAARNAGVPEQDSDWLRDLLHRAIAREPGQRGTAPENAQAMGEVFGYLHELIVSCREGRASASGLLAELLEASIGGVGLDDMQIAAELHTLLVTGSETTELGMAGAVWYLFREPEQRAEVLADPKLSVFAFAETIRIDHPTDILCRVVRQDVSIGGKALREGQGVLLLWGSANRDDEEFPEADRFDIGRRPTRSLLFGHGQHKCIGEHLGMRMGAILLEELFVRIADYEVDIEGVRRRRGEFLKGFCAMPMVVRSR